MNLESEIKEINRVGKTTASRFKKININKIEDLLFYFPFRYKDFTKPKKINEIKDGEEVSIKGQIELIQNRRSRKRGMNITEALVSDETGEIKVLWFNQKFITQNLKNGDQISLAGKIKQNLGELALMSPIYEKLSSEKKTTHTQGLIPHYHSTEKLSQKQIRFVVKSALKTVNEIKDWLPEKIKKDLNLINLDKAIKEIHFPENKKSLELAQRRLSFNELFLIQLKSQLIKKEFKNQKGNKIKFNLEKTKEFISKLPFKITNAQKKCTWEIIQDLEKEKPMTRLLEGDVGSGKTLVAVIAMLNTSYSKELKQSVLMVPTEILALQHFKSITKLLEKNNSIKIGLITKDNKKINYEKEKWEKTTKKEKEKIISQTCHIIIGTHSLIQESINFKNLSLAIIDEQHRFGVKQRKSLVEKSGDKKTAPHLLSMTATPIPRSLALGLFGDLDISIIDELPSSRKIIKTHIVGEEKRIQAYSFIGKEIEKGRQVFVVCPLIDPSDKLGVRSVKEEYEKLKNKIFKDKKIGIIHGKLKPKEKEETMNAFLDKKYEILVSTSIIEVGVDIPNASIMIIEGSDRFGLSQLHQFRGRVGRGEYQSYCFLFTDSNNEKTKERLKIMEKHNDGFELAKMDLKLRGSGELYGTAQKGFPQLKIASLFDYKLIKLAQDKAMELTKKDKIDKYPLLKEKLRLWEEDVHGE